MTTIQPSIQQLAKQLASLSYQLVTAESCTGGLVAAYCTELPGSSQWFERGFVTYSNAAKQECLSVPQTIIEQHGAVSEAAAQAMAEGALQHSQAQVALSITGIAGPGGGSQDKPVGTVCFGWAITQQATRVSTQCFDGDRESVRQQAALFAVRQLLQWLPPKKML